MCRIFGYLGHQNISTETLEKVSHLQIQGGPDHQRFIQKKQWALGNNRLAIQGLDGGIQPFQLGQKISVVFNGEIYNHNELRKMLIHRGYQFHDHCDGSIIPALYNEYGVEFVRYLDGMFAIAIVDTRNEPTLLLASDPTGIKSVYYYWDENKKTLKFSSELSSLLGFGDTPSRIRPQAVDDYLTGRALWGDKTVYENILTLPPASLLIAKLHRVPRVVSYNSLIDSDISLASVDEAAAYLDEVIEKEIKAMMLADVPVCVVTSGGLDSSYVTALAKKYCDKLHSFTIGYDGDFPCDERHFAREVADRYNTHHHTIEIAEKDFPRLMDKMIEHIGQPNSAPHCLSTYALFEAIHREGFKVALTGEGADEFFSGYRRYSMAANDPNTDWLSRYLDKMSVSSKSIREKLYSPSYKDFLRENTTLYDSSYTAIMHEEKQGKNRLETLLNFDQLKRFPYYILRRVDHLSMANSVEVRVPFCQPRIAALARKLPQDFKVNAGRDKYILYKAAEGKLPPTIMNRPKQPFTLPVVAMLKKGHILFDMMVDTLNSQDFKGRNIFTVSEIDKLIQQQLNKPDEKVAETLWALMVFERWLLCTKN